MTRSASSTNVRPCSRRWRASVVAAVVVLSGCRVELALERQLEARRLAAALGGQFAQAAAATSRALMAPQEDVAASVREAKTRVGEVQAALDALAAQLRALDYADEGVVLSDVQARFAAYRRVDDALLDLAAAGADAAASPDENASLRALEQSMTRRRLLTAACADGLRAVDEALARRTVTATR